MASAAVTAAPSREWLRDPVLLLPAAVAAGLAVGWLGVHEHVAGSRVAADLALAWSLTIASIVALERPRWRRASWLLAAAAFALLVADLEWASPHALSTFGLALQGLWAALLIQLALTFPDGRPWSRTAVFAMVAAYAVTIGGQLAADQAQEIASIAVALLVLFLVLRRLHGLRGPARRAQAPLLVAFAVTVGTGVVWLGSLLAADAGSYSVQTLVRVVALTIPVGVVAGIGWSRLRRPRAAELVVDLQRDSSSMRERLARALDDPTLDVAYRLGDGRYVDASGRPLELPHGDGRAITTVTAGGEEIAALLHDPALLDEPALVDSVRATAALVLENERLAAEVRAQLAEVRASRGRIVAAGDAERRRIERNLHDGAQQRLVTLSVALGLEASGADPETAQLLARAQDEVEQAIAELRDLARGIHPTLLRDEGLGAAVEALARRTPLPVTVRSTLRERLPDSVELAAYFVVAEALTNVVKHASASQASVLLERGQQDFRVVIDDDGVGGAHIEPDSGLAGLRDRLEALDATLRIESAAGGGTTVCAVLPCA
jgi:signal transduction histidine kinase